MKERAKTAIRIVVAVLLIVVLAFLVGYVMYCDSHHHGLFG